MNQKVLIHEIHEYDPQKIQVIVEEAIIELDLIGQISDKNILMKPNCLFAVEPDLGIITNPKFIEGVIRAFSKYSNKIFITDSPGWGSFESVIKKAGIDLILEKYKVSIIPEKYYIDGNINGKILKSTRIIQGIEGMDFIVNLPKMKTHAMTEITGAVKNLFGLVHGKTKAKLHFRYNNPKNFYRMLLDIYEYIRPGLNIMDGIISLEGRGPGTSGKVKKTSKVLISKDAVLLDLYFAYMVSAEKSIQVMLDEYPEFQWFDEKDDIPVIQGFELPDKTLGLLTHIPVPEKISEWMREIGMPYPEVDQDKCKTCNRCVDNCPSEPCSINKDKNGKLIISNKTCIRCYCCEEICPHEAIKMKRNIFQKLFNWILGT
ncbi:DUF362 domain-containing protein [bacterium]|nr:DUF362 domain-containing protein [bacterium]